ncbi:MAG TPA: TraR/DksA C4-type zinc finger protein [Bryobacteraceae bacterium]|nr:TraR/DksA C4-type zinc finger protein [Bryobacteraceae bacterium]
MNKNTTAIRRELESHLKRSTENHGLRESIRIHQLADPLDMTQQAAEREMVVLNLDRSTAIARRLRAAIDRVDNGTYGICLECEAEIAPNRLEAIPWAELCIRCQENADQSQSKAA